METGTGVMRACITKHPRSALRTTFATRSGGSGESISSVVSAPSMALRMVSCSTEPVDCVRIGIICPVAGNHWGSCERT